MMRPLALVVILATLFVSACVGINTGPGYFIDTDPVAYAKIYQMNAEQQQREDDAWRFSYALSVEEQVERARNFFADRTIIYYGEGHGIQIEYSSAKGKTYLWYPGNPRLVKGPWSVHPTSKGAKICFKYLGPTINPVTGSTAAEECVNAAKYVSGVDVLDSRRGDPFGLQKGIPYILTRNYLPKWPELEDKTKPDSE